MWVAHGSGEMITRPIVQHLLRGSGTKQAIRADPDGIVGQPVGRV